MRNGIGNEGPVVALFITLHMAFPSSLTCSSALASACVRCAQTDRPTVLSARVCEMCSQGQARFRSQSVSRHQTKCDVRCVTGPRL